MKKFTLVSLAIASLLLISCKSPTGDEGTEKFRLNISVEPLEAGAVSPVQGEYDKGEKVQLIATPNEHWVFLQWGGDHTGTISTTTITMDKDKTITALFNAREYPLNISIEGQGSVGERVVQQKNDGYEAGTLVELTAVADEGWLFQEWQGALTGTENPATITINAETIVTAIFARKNYGLTVSVEGEGTVSEEVIPAKTTDYPYQTTVQLTANPAEGWEFSHWSGDVTGETNPVQITIEGDSEVTAVFIKRYFTVTISYSGAGSTFIDLITGNRSGDQYEYGSVISIRVQPYDNWEFIRWEGDLSGTENPMEVTVTGNITATAVMKQTLFDGEGTISNPYLITTLDQLQAVSSFIDKHFRQVNNIDASETEYWNEGRGFQPIAFIGIGSFTGSYDGGGFTISGLTVDLSGGIYLENTTAGLFGRIQNAQIKDLTLTNINITSVPGVPVGGLAGWATSGSTIQNVHVTGQITGNDNIGGLVGIAETVLISGSSTDVAVNGNNSVGGLVGYSGLAWIYNSQAMGSVTGIQSVGGLIGNRQVGEMISYSSAKGDVSGAVNVGGLIGSSFNTVGPVLVSYATGNVTGEQNVGGLIGIYNGSGLINQGYASGSVTSTNNGSFAGGLIGRLLSGELSKSYALGDVSGYSGVGGAIGRNDTDGSVTETYAAGRVTATQFYGGLMGVNQGVLNASYWDTETSGQAGPVWDPYQGVNNATGLTTSEMTGTNAQLNMSEFDWLTTWKTGTGYPVFKTTTPKAVTYSKR
ncbi:hypothetical protein G3570_01420 [Balneolaceae bacterium YR4-1]|uniref:GLUG domain-containing protein n=1 Tax=Halalkalibaculum roseum TaxID=2709311 RepID=A0A6M1SXI6_9BACT|nr:ZmpA/ZmpB/ZmpC family metallo-endopeptidase-related protein [Halalkalibaculum roseum]NGP75277.1 hypothetical protein [Halalkalibaculum roseum]